MISGSPQDVFENSSHRDDFGSPQGHSRDEARSFWGRLSLGQSKQNARIFSFFAWSSPDSRPHGRPKSSCQHPERGLDSKRPSLLPLNLSQPETRLAAHLIGVILSPRTEVIQHFPAGGDPLKDFVPKERNLTDESIQSHSCSLANNVSLTLHA